MHFVPGTAASIALCVVAACSPLPSAPAPTAVPTVMARFATVTDRYVPFDATESDALVPRGPTGQGTYGRLVQGCSVEVIKTTDRAARVRVITCPSVDIATSTSIAAQVEGWVAKSALDLSR